MTINYPVFIKPAWLSTICRQYDDKLSSVYELARLSTICSQYDDKLSGVY